jgi:PAS domain S-box-containing protein
VEPALRAQAALLNALGHAVIATDLAGIVTFWNDAAVALYGWTSVEALGRNIVDLTPSTPSREQAAEIMRDLADGKTWTGEFPVMRKDGTSFPARVTDTPVYDDAGRLVAIVGISSDISEMKEKERALRESEQRFRELAEHINEVFYVVGTDGRLEYVSPAYETIWGRAAAPRREHDLAHLEAIHPDDRARYVEMLESLGRRSGDLEYRIIRPDGTLRWIHDRTFPIRDDRGDILRVAGVAEDVTARKEAELALMES